MSKRLQVVMTDDAWKIVETLFTEANHNFDVGHISYSDTINELIVCSKPDIKQLQLKHTSIRRSLVALANQQDLDIDMAIKALTELRNKAPRRNSRQQMEMGESG